MSVGKGVLRIRQDKGLTQRQVGERAGLATSYVSRIENGRIQPTMVTLARIAEALEVTVTQVFQVSEETKPVQLQRCPVSGTGQCIGELIRSRHGRHPESDFITYGPDELRLLRMTDYLVLHAPAEVRNALLVFLECLTNESGRRTGHRVPANLIGRSATREEAPAAT